MKGRFGFGVCLHLCGFDRPCHAGVVEPARWVLGSVHARRRGRAREAWCGVSDAAVVVRVLLFTLGVAAVDELRTFLGIMVVGKRGFLGHSPLPALGSSSCGHSRSSAGDCRVAAWSLLSARPVPILVALVVVVAVCVQSSKQLLDCLHEPEFLRAPGKRRTQRGKH